MRYIQPYEADFNVLQQFIFGKEAMDSLKENGLFPKKRFSKKGNTAEDANLDKTLTEDLSRQAQHPMTVVSVDAVHCYDRINHVIMMLV